MAAEAYGDGPVTAAVRGVVASLDLDDLGRARAELAICHARNLDSGKALMASAAMGRELRDTLRELTGEDNANDDFAAFVQGLAAT